MSADTPQAPGAPSAPTTTQDATAVVEAKNGTNPNEAFARRERQLRRQQQELQQQKQAWEAQRKQYETDYVPKSKLKEDFWSVAQEAGLDYDQLTEQVLSQPNDPATKALLAKVRAMEDSMNSTKRQAEEAQQTQYQNAIKQITNQVKMLVDGDAEFETIKSLELYDDVVARIESDFKETGIVRDSREVALEIENELIEDALRFAQLPKVQNRMKATPVNETTPGTPTAPTPEGGTVDALRAAIEAKKQKQKSSQITITNRMSEGTAPKGNSEKERRERALAAFRGQSST